MYTTKNYGGLDRFRVAAALLVIAIHTSPLASVNETADFFLTRVLARIAVPFFLMVTGQFVVARFLDSSQEESFLLKKYLAKAALLYAACILLYLPLGIYAGHYKDMTIGTALRMLAFDGTFYHLWYFPAAILGILLLYFMSRFLSLRLMTFVSAILYVIGLFGDSYYGIAQKAPVIESAYEFIFQISSHTRNGLFFAPLFLVMGAWAGVKAQRQESTAGEAFAHQGEQEWTSGEASGGHGELLSDVLGFALSFAVMCGEAFLLRLYEYQRHDSMYLMLIPTMYFLYQCLLASRRPCGRILRTASAWIYILHPGCIVAVRAAAKPLGLTALLVENSMVHYLAVTLLSVFTAFLIALLHLKLRSLSTRRDREKKIAEICGILDMEEQAAREMQESQEAPAFPGGYPEEMPDYILEPSEGQEGLQDPMTETMEMTEGFPEIQGTSGEVSPNRFPRNPNIQTPESLPRGKRSMRAWIELDSKALERNVAFLRSRIPDHCRLMPAIKAEAYGHGGVIIARLLSDMGVDAFCVACLYEAVTLRESGIQGEILILGYTPPEDFPMLERYQLTQSVVDYEYACMLARYDGQLHVHVAIDTGMHRLGIRCENLEEIFSVCQMKNLSVDGFFTHLSVSDSLLRQDVMFTDAQVQAFYQVMDILREEGYPCHGMHILASYGILNLLEDAKDSQNLSSDEGLLEEGLPWNGEHGIQNKAELAADYVRPGIALYGILSSQADSSAWRGFLRPVLSLKARVSSVRPLYAGEATGYGAAYTAKKDMKIATISIGYADGLPRALSHGRGRVLINGYKAPILGRICMDQTIVDVSQIPHVQAGDIAVIIGKSGSLENTADALASQSGTITNELLSRLGGRLERILRQ